MVSTSYKRWERKGTTIRAFGGRDKKYVHNCPYADFLIIVKNIINIEQKEGTVSKLDILNKLENKSLNKKRIFKRRSHQYKVNMVFDILILEDLLVRKGIKKYYTERRGRNPYAYVLTKPADNIQEWVKNIK